MTKPNTTYKPLGDYIRPVDIRNRDLQVTKLLGLSIEKCFIPSIANTIGTDMSTYKIVMPGQFAYGPVTSRNGDKITIALYTGDEPAIISQAYVVFEIVDREKLLPEYLMMWFRRPEFDRYARYHSHGSAREIFDWAEMCATMVPVPPISEQRAVVADYEAVARRISVAKRTIATLQATAQALYRKTFVDGIDKENLPEGWRWGTLGEVCEIKYGKDHKNVCNGTIPIYGSGGIMRYGNQALYSKESVLVPRKGSLNNIMFVDDPFWTVDTMFYSHMKQNHIAKYVYFNLIQYDFLSMDAGSAVPSMTADMLNRLGILIPDEIALSDFDNKVSVIFNAMKSYSKEFRKLTEIQSLLLAGIGK